jgi:transposase
MAYIASTGVPWRDLPERFGPWKTVHTRFSRWNERGIFEKLLKALTADADQESNMADATYVRAHQHSAGGKGGPKSSALDALAAVLQRKSTRSLMVSATPSTSTSRRETSTTSSKRRG